MSLAMQLHNDVFHIFQSFVHVSFSLTMNIDLHLKILKQGVNRLAASKSNRTVDIAFFEWGRSLGVKFQVEWDVPRQPFVHR